MKNEFQLTPDDPRLTAYALGELEPEEMAAVAAALETQAELRAAVADIQATAGRIEAALEAEPALECEATPTRAAVDEFSPHRSAAPPFLLPSHSTEYTPLNGRASGSKLARLMRFPHLYYIVPGLAAAGFAMLVIFQDRRPPATTRIYEVDLRGGGAAASAATSEHGTVKVALPSVDKQDESMAPPSLALLDQVDTRQNKAALEPVAPLGAVRLDAASVTAPADLAAMMPVPKPLVPVSESSGTARTGQGALFSDAVAGGRTLASVSVPPASSTGAAQAAKNGESLGAAGGGIIKLQPFEVSVTRETGYLAGGIGSSIGGSITLGAPALAPAGPIDLFPGSRSRASEPEHLVAAPPNATPNTEAYSFVRDNEFLGAGENPLSTFSIDVDTASYSNVRRFLQAGRLPPADAVRIEELINYFPYHYTPPAAHRGGDDAPPFAASMEVAEAPWAPAHRLVRIGLKGREVVADARPAANLVFLLDVSGSMNEPAKLPLVKEAMRLLLGKLRPDDRVAIVTYAGSSGLALPSTPVAKAREIVDALESLRPGGSTNGAMGIQLAYDVAKANLVSEGVNRVILCTDGDFNVGVTSQGELVRLVEEKAKSGVFLTVLGFGMGNLKDSTLEVLAGKGNGSYGYIDNQREAEKLLVEQVSGTLVTIAKDVKIQVDFNPEQVRSYRLIGYENRILKKEDFNNDQVDAGEIGAGHTVTALYEVVLAGGGEQPGVAMVEESKYQPRPVAAKLPAAIASELLTVRIRYKEPAGEVSRKLEFPLSDSGRQFTNASADFKFTSALAAFGMILRDSPHKGQATIGNVIEWAAAGAANAADDPRGYRREFLDLARRAQALLGK